MTTPKDQWKEVDYRFGLLNMDSWGNKQFHFTDSKIIKSFLHSELEKVRQETIEKSRGKLLNYFHNKFFASTSLTEQETMCFVKAVIEKEVLELFGITNKIEETKGKDFIKKLRQLALSINKKQQ